MHFLSDYTYTLPPDRIAQTLADPPDSCRLLVYDRNTKQREHTYFRNLPNYLRKDTLLVFNISKVVKARLYLPHMNGEIFFLRAHDTHRFEALVRPGKKFKVGEKIVLPGSDIWFDVVSISEHGRELRCNQPIFEVLETHGNMPLPPYIGYDEQKSTAYQPLFAKEAGSVAAPTASLHFTQSLLEKLKYQGVQTAETVLHIGLGTFKQVDVEDITAYDIHTEIIDVSRELFEGIAERKKQGTPVVAVGTTVTRTLETMPFLRKLYRQDFYQQLSETAGNRRDSLTHDITQQQAEEIVFCAQINETSIRCETKLYLYPGKQFHVIDQLITNFHLPKSSLLMLVAARMGYNEMMQTYQTAIEEKYLFYSFGDAMVIK